MDDARLAPPPRKIPMSIWMAELLPFRWSYFLIVVLIGSVPIVLWIWYPAFFTVAAVATVLGIYLFHFWGASTRVALLKHGEVAKVMSRDVISYGDTTVSDTPLPIAHGWTVTRPLYSGPDFTTRVRYTVSGVERELTVSGREYINGVVLADPREPSRALCVTSFPYDLDRDESGNWIGNIRTPLKVGMGAWLFMVVVWLGLALIFALL